MPPPASLGYHAPDVIYEATYSFSRPRHFLLGFLIVGFGAVWGYIAVRGFLYGTTKLGLCIAGVSIGLLIAAPGASMIYAWAFHRVETVQIRSDGVRRHFLHPWGTILRLGGERTAHGVVLTITKRPGRFLMSIGTYPEIRLASDDFLDDVRFAELFDRLLKVSDAFPHVWLDDVIRARRVDNRMDDEVRDELDRRMRRAGR